VQYADNVLQERHEDLQSRHEDEEADLHGVSYIYVHIYIYMFSSTNRPVQYADNVLQERHEDEEADLHGVSYIYVHIYIYICSYAQIDLCNTQATSCKSDTKMKRQTYTVCPTYMYTYIYIYVLTHK